MVSLSPTSVVEHCRCVTRRRPSGVSTRELATIASVTKPIIGLPGRRKKVADITGFPPALGHVDLDVYFAGYAREVIAAGGLPVHLPTDSDPLDFVESLDGIVLSGGADIVPARYGAEADGNGDYEPHRDDFEFALLEGAVKRQLPVLGICRGIQVINVFFGGTLHQHQPDHARYDVDPDTRVHNVRLEPGSILGGIYGRDELPVNSLHHQSVDQPGTDLQVTAVCPTDGTIEAVEHMSCSIVGVQWHPEMHHAHEQIFDWLVKQAENRPK